ncbi:MAG: class I adenylate-forming enzyme family protein [Vicinamibacteria bacterium]
MRTSSPELMDKHRKTGLWSEIRITDLFDANVLSNADGLALADPPNRGVLVGGEPWRLTFARLDAMVNGYALRLLDLGFQADDILVVQLPNISELVAIYLAAMKLGIIISPAAMQFRRHELEQVTALTEAKAILTVRQFKTTKPHEEALAAMTAVKAQVFVLGDDAPEGTTAFTPVSITPEGLKRLHDHTSAHPVSSDDIATICWTSGTEGLPKGVPRSHNHWLAISHAHFEAAGIRRGDILLNPFPLVNMAALGGCFMSWLRSAGTLVLHHPVDLLVYLSQIAAERPNYAIAPPAVLNMLLADPKLLAQTDLSTLRCIGSGSAPLDPAMIRSFNERFGIEVVNLFGSNEGMSLGSGLAEAADPEHRARYFPRFGRPDLEWKQKSATLIKTRIMDPDTGAEILEAGRPGEMQIKGPTVFDGYYKAPKLTKETFTEDGWFCTGDLFEIAAEGGELRYYRFVGRLKQLIIRGGVKIAPEELEAFLATHPDIAEASAVSYPDAILGERICAIVVPKKKDARITLEGLQTFFKGGGFAPYKWPERVHTVEALPRNAVGKVVRSSLSPIAQLP